MTDGAPMRTVHYLADVDGAELPSEATMAQGHSRPAWAEIDLSAVTHNTRVLAGVAAPAQLCAVVKAHGYGHGGPAVARAALAGGAQRLAVALVDEGVELREHGITGPVLLLSECGAEAVDTAIEFGLTPTLYSSEAIAAFSAGARAAGHTTSVHLKVDTGMHRVGADPAQVAEVVGALSGAGYVRFAGLWTHFPVADGTTAEDRAFTAAQLERFETVRRALADAGMEAPLQHAANSAAALCHPVARLDMVRCGISVYGLLPAPGLATADLRPALSLHARVSLVRSLDAGERPSYGRRYPLPERSVVATVPIGYADGMPRRYFEAGGTVLVGGRHRPLAGSVTMDQVMVDCGPDSGVAVGDEVVLIGSQGAESISAWDWATALGTIAYEVVCGIGPRVPRVVVDSAAAPSADGDAEQASPEQRLVRQGRLSPPTWGGGS